MNERQLHLAKFKSKVEIVHSSLNLKYLHFKTIDNFIFHLDRVKNKDDEEWIFNSITKYLSICAEIQWELDRKTSSELYDEFLDKIASYYRSHLNFSMVVNKISYGVMFLFAFLLVGLIFGFYISLIIIPLFIHFLIHVDKKQRKKTVYGIFY